MGLNVRCTKISVKVRTFFKIQKNNLLIWRFANLSIWRFADDLLDFIEYKKSLISASVEYSV